MGHSNDRGKDEMNIKPTFRGFIHNKAGVRSKDIPRKKLKKPKNLVKESIVDPRQSLMNQYFPPSPKITNKILVGSVEGDKEETTGVEYERLG